MQFQEQRSLAFLASNIILTGAWVLVVLLNWPDRVLPLPGDPAFLAGALLVFVPLHIAARILIMIAFAIARQCASERRGQTPGDPIDLEDELDKLIDLKSIRVGTWFFMPGVLAGLACLALGQPPQALVLALGAGMVLSGLAGDLATLVMYRRGV